MSYEKRRRGSTEYVSETRDTWGILVSIPTSLSFLLNRKGEEENEQSIK